MDGSREGGREGAGSSVVGHRTLVCRVDSLGYLDTKRAVSFQTANVPSAEPTYRKHDHVTLTIPAQFIVVQSRPPEYGQVSREGVSGVWS